MTIGPQVRAADQRKGPHRPGAGAAAWSPTSGSLPAVLLYVLFKLAPMIGGIYLALLKLGRHRAAGLHRPAQLRAHAQRRGDRPGASGTTCSTPSARSPASSCRLLVLALLLNQALRGRAFYRTALFLPVVMSFVVVGILWTWLYNTPVWPDQQPASTRRAGVPDPGLAGRSERRAVVADGGRYLEVVRLPHGDLPRRPADDS